MSEIPWSQTKTLEETVIDLIERKETKSEAFHAILSFYGRERLETIWKAHKLKQAGEGVE